MENNIYLNFKQIVYQISETYPDLISKSNVSYRNGSKIMEIFGFIIKQNNNDNTLTKEEALSLGMGEGSSTWAQISRFINEFNLDDKSFTEKTTEFRLNRNGIELRNEINSNFKVEELLNWKDRKNNRGQRISRNLPELVKIKYQNILINQNLNNFTPVLKTCFCALLASCDGKLFKQDEKKTSSKFQVNIAKKYFDLSPGTKDVKWVGWIGAILEDLGMVDLDENKTFFKINDTGSNVINQIVKNWEKVIKENLDEDKYNDNQNDFDSYEEEFDYKPKKSNVPPNRTERKGLVTSRVGQGWFRQELLYRWEGKCSVTNCSLYQILIASHIVPWKLSNNEERLSIGNGLLLSPNLDALFDRHLISFDKHGSILISKKLNLENLSVLGITSEMKLKTIFDDMIYFLEKHQQKFYSNI